MIIITTANPKGLLEKILADATSPNGLETFGVIEKKFITRISDQKAYAAKFEGKVGKDNDRIIFKLLAHNSPLDDAISSYYEGHFAVILKYRYNEYIDLVCIK